MGEENGISADVAYEQTCTYQNQPLLHLMGCYMNTHHHLRFMSHTKLQQVSANCRP